jgi:hypothetical protein
MKDEPTLSLCLTSTMPLFCYNLGFASIPDGKYNQEILDTLFLLYILLNTVGPRYKVLVHFRGKWIYNLEVAQE